MASKGKKVHENFSAEDRELLIEYVKLEIKFVESKHKHTFTNRKKQQIWTNIVEKFNCQSEAKRTVTQLKGVWKRLKIKAHKDMATQKCGQKVTGDGKSHES